MEEPPPVLVGPEPCPPPPPPESALTIGVESEDIDLVKDLISGMEAKDISLAYTSFFSYSMESKAFLKEVVESLSMPFDELPELCVPHIHLSDFQLLNFTRRPLF